MNNIDIEAIRADGIETIRDRALQIIAGWPEDGPAPDIDDSQLGQMLAHNVLALLPEVERLRTVADADVRWNSITNCIEVRTAAGRTAFGYQPKLSELIEAANRWQQRLADAQEAEVAAR